jgi:hypothetical protein
VAGLHLLSAATHRSYFIMDYLLVIVGIAVVALFLLGRNQPKRPIIIVRRR